MEDATKVLSDILGGEDAISRIGELASVFGLGGEGGGIGDILGALGAGGSAAASGGERSDRSQQGGSGLGDILGALGGIGGGSGGGIDPAALLGIGRALGELRAKDKNIELIEALRPHLSADRQAKADEAVKILRLLRLWPVIKESGLLKGLL